ncbi:hypothetical protein HPB47_005864 [Ixodes persulcatus]|uniref:Uncharacterized protein n=1 Tax=Ixodes persulcatus TaxID=34615 RepID=A0AC60PBS8_IXOPE|nr:hypothetical protein HPB47_005864 [Ixodes persulcatus]
MATPLEPLCAQAGRKRFTILEDILLSREVLAVNPFVNSSRWNTVAANLNEAMGSNFSVRRVRDRCDLLLEQYTEKEQLLQDVADLARKFGYKVKPVLRKATATEEGATTTSTATLEPPERTAATTARPATNRAAGDAATTARGVAAAADRLAMEERQIERRLAIEERQVTLSEDRLAFEKEKFYVLQEAAAEERRHRLQLQEHYVQRWVVGASFSSRGTPDRKTRLLSPCVMKGKQGFSVSATMTNVELEIPAKCRP